MRRAERRRGEEGREARSKKQEARSKKHDGKKRGAWVIECRESKGKDRKVKKSRRMAQGP